MLEAEDHPGPVVLCDGRPATPEEVALCASVSARYGDGKDRASVRVRVEGIGAEPSVLDVEPFRDQERLRRWMV